MVYLFINTSREGYAPEQCRETLTVGELKQILEDYEDDTPIYLKNDNGYTYGAISEDDFEEGEKEKEEED